MSKKTYYILFGLLLIFSIILKISALKGNNFYFTMDQARDAILVRQILKGQLTLEGPATSINNLYIGPIWYYFISLAYLIGFGSPIAPIILLILVNTLILAFTILIIKKTLNPLLSLIYGLSLSLLPQLFDTSWYAFNPHLLPLITLGIIYLLSEERILKTKYYYIVPILLGLSFHVEFAFIPPLALIYILSNIYYLMKKRITIKKFLFSIFIIISFLIPHLISEFKDDFFQTKSLFNHLSSNNSVFSEVKFIARFLEITKDHLKLISQTTIALNHFIGSIPYLLLVIFTIIIKLFKKKTNLTFKFNLFTFLLIIISIIWFSTNKGLSSWHLIGLPIIIFTSLFLSLSILPKNFQLVLSIILLSLQIYNFSNRFKNYYYFSDDPSILSNELAAIDWAYQKNSGKSFQVYTFMPSVYDYPYQYLFPWYGQKKYNYLPCEYATNPESPTSTYIKDTNKYQEKDLVCDNNSSIILIIEPPVEQLVLDRWYEEVTRNTTLIEKGNIGLITLEKRQKN